MFSHWHDRSEHREGDVELIPSPFHTVWSNYARQGGRMKIERIKSSNRKKERVYVSVCVCSMIADSNLWRGKEEWIHTHRHAVSFSMFHASYPILLFGNLDDDDDEATLSWSYVFAFSCIYISCIYSCVYFLYRLLYTFPFSSCLSLSPS